MYTALPLICQGTNPCFRSKWGGDAVAEETVAFDQERTRRLQSLLSLWITGRPPLAIEPLQSRIFLSSEYQIGYARTTKNTPGVMKNLK